jgi:light-regulated signal transduction histidine kinase (bacteriophytochrome)
VWVSKISSTPTTCDPTPIALWRIKIALKNLLSNTWKYTSKKEIAEISFGAKEYKGEKIFYIKDNGIGFEMSAAEKLFVPFKRLHSGSQFTGTGIGLSIVDRIISKHGGRIWGEGETGKGATFYFTLPN